MGSMITNKQPKNAQKRAKTLKKPPQMRGKCVIFAEMKTVLVPSRERFSLMPV
jgi:hypothetical protein